MAKTLAMIFGVVFVVIGALGFFNDPVLGMFEVDTIHNIVHIVLGLILIAGSRSSNPRGAASSMRTVGIIYLILAVLGFILVGDEGQLFGLVDMNHADHWLHVVLGVVLLIAGMAGKPKMQQSQPMSGGNPQM